METYKRCWKGKALRRIFSMPFFVLKGEKTMFKKVCKTIELIGTLRKTISEIDFKQIYGDEMEAMKVRHAILEKEETLTEIQAQLFDAIGRVE